MVWEPATTATREERRLRFERSSLEEVAPTEEVQGFEEEEEEAEGGLEDLLGCFC